MITALDTNVLLDVLLADDKHADESIRAIKQGAQKGSLVICELVYAELCGYFSAKSECDLFLGENQINIDSLGAESCFLASRIWRQYRKQGGPRTRIMPDFLIGAHAQLRASCLVSRDDGFFRKLFPRLKILPPAN